MTPLETLRAFRSNYPTPMSPDQLGQILNAVAWAHRAEGYGLLSKPTGANCHQPTSGILVSRDILMLAGSGRIFDCLIDAEGKATPTWGEKSALSPSRFVAPVDPTITGPPDGPPDVPEPPPVVSVPYIGDAAGFAIGDTLFADYAKAGQAPNAGMGTWFMRVAWDCANPPYMSVTDAIEKHRAEWRKALGL